MMKWATHQPILCIIKKSKFVEKEAQEYHLNEFVLLSFSC